MPLFSLLLVMLIMKIFIVYSFKFISDKVKETILKSIMKKPDENSEAEFSEFLWMAEEDADEDLQQQVRS